MSGTIDPADDLEQRRRDLADYRNYADYVANPDAHYRARLAEYMHNLAQEPAGLAAVRDLAILAHNPSFKLPVRSELRLARAGLIDVTSKPELTVYSPEDIRAALSIESGQVWLGNPAIHLGTTETLRIPRVYDKATQQWVTAQIPVQNPNAGRAV